MREIRKIVVHCLDTYPSMDPDVEEVCRWHVEGRGWDDIGYHYLIRRSGMIQTGREVEVAGAHVRGHNHDSIGVALSGGKARDGRQACNFTAEQWNALERHIRILKTRYPDAEVLGHNDLDSGKTCPTFDVKAWWANGEKDG